MKNLTAKSGRVAATTTGKDRRHRQRPALDHASTRGVKGETTPTGTERIENQDEAEGLAQLVVTFFGDEIRDALIEVEASLSNKKVVRQRPVRHEKYRGK